MVKKKTTIKDKAISENDRLKVQLLNSNVDRAALSLDNAQLRMENARLAVAIAQRTLDTANADLNAFGRDLETKYCFSMHTDSVNWETGEIKRKEEDDGEQE